MVYVAWTVLAHGRRVDTAGVAAKVVSDLEGDRDWLLVDCLLELNFVESRDVHRLPNCELERGGIHSTGTVSCKVRIVILGGNSAGIVDVFEGMGGETSVAAVVIETTSAVNELLL